MAIIIQRGGILGRRTAEGTFLDEANNLSDVDDAAIAFANIKQNATSAVTGVIEIAIDAEAIAKAAVDRALVPSNIPAIMAEPGAIGGTTPAAGNFTTLGATGDATFGSVSDPGAIGGTIPDAGNFTTLDASGNLTVGDTTRVTINATDDTDGIVFGSLGTATRGIDLSGSGLGSQDWGYVGQSVLIGSDGDSEIGEFTACTVGAVAAIIQHADIDANTATGDMVHVISGTGVTTGIYRLVTVGANQITVDRNVSGAGGADIVCKIYKDVIGFFATDGTNGQRIMNYSHQDKPLQIGGDTLAATGHSLGAEDVLIGGNLFEIDPVAFFDQHFHIAEITTPSAVANFGAVYTKTDNILYFQDGDGIEHNIGGDTPVFKSFMATTQGLGANPDVYVAGFYEAPAADANLNQGSTTVTLGTANKAEGAHAFLVAAAAGTVDAGTVSIVVSGISITDAGDRSAADTETIVADITAMSTNAYYETAKKWLGQVTYTLTPAGATTYAADFNYGFAKYEDYGNRDFKVTDFEVCGFAGANDANFDIILYHHSSTGWTYSTAAFVAGGTVICQLSTDYSTDDQLFSVEPFAYKRSGLTTSVTGSGSEGVIVDLITTANNAIEYATVTVGAEL